MENANFAIWTCLTWFHLSDVKVINEIKVILRSRSLQGHIVGV